MIWTNRREVRRRKRLQSALNRYEWNDWFAWFPVSLEGDPPRKAWLEHIERKRDRIGMWFFWIYRTK